jgi:SAM-dependent methyltransferase
MAEGMAQLSRRRTLELEREFYEQHWKSAGDASHAQERERIRLTASAVPSGVKRILDVGCGDGRLSEAIRHKQECFLVAFDLSMTALHRLAGPKVCGSAAQMPFRDRSFDLVVCTEMMEHLPEETYGAVEKEISRVANGFILITVPNQENLTENLALCPTCGSQFHIWGHLRTFSCRTLENLFEPFELVRTFAFGDNVESYNKSLLWIRQRLAGGFAWEEGTACYFCQATRPPTPRRAFVQRVCDSLNARFWTPLSKRPGWLLGLYARRGSC